MGSEPKLPLSPLNPTTGCAKLAPNFTVESWNRKERPVEQCGRFSEVFYRHCFCMRTGIVGAEMTISTTYQPATLFIVYLFIWLLTSYPLETLVSRDSLFFTRCSNRVLWESLSSNVPMVWHLGALGRAPSHTSVMLDWLTQTPKLIFRVPSRYYRHSLLSNSSRLTQTQTHSGSELNSGRERPPMDSELTRAKNLKRTQNSLELGVLKISRDNFGWNSLELRRTQTKSGSNLLTIPSAQTHSG